MVLALVIGGVTSAVALVIDWIPVNASEEAGRIETLLWFLVFASIIVFTLVVTFLVYSVWKFRAAPGDESDGPPLHGNTLLEIVWTAVPAVLLLIVSIYSYFVLAANEDLDPDRLTVNVTAEQFAWTFAYPDGGFESGDLRLPVDRQVALKMRAKDVIHDLYVPEFLVKMDTVPGITTTLVVKPTKVGTYPIVCAELCGVGHNTMRARVIVMPQAAYDAWATSAAATVRAQLGA
jgi:cytochrome c oxidase subunit 2